MVCREGFINKVCTEGFIDMVGSGGSLTWSVVWGGGDFIETVCTEGFMDMVCTERFIDMVGFVGVHYMVCTEGFIYMVGSGAFITWSVLRGSFIRSVVRGLLHGEKFIYTHTYTHILRGSSDGL